MLCNSNLNKRQTGHSCLALLFVGETVEECVSDLMDQFIESADIESLKKYHLTAVQTKSYAMTQGWRNPLP